jgi:hypothetical protein
LFQTTNKALLIYHAVSSALEQLNQFEQEVFAISADLAT